jgi:hypothetical protein
MNLEEVFQKYSIETLRTIPENIATVYVFDLNEYNKLIGSIVPEDILEKNRQDKLLSSLLVGVNVSKSIKKEHYRIYLKYNNWGVKVSEKKIEKFLKEVS